MSISFNSNNVLSSGQKYFGSLLTQTTNNKEQKENNIFLSYFNLDNSKIKKKPELDASTIMANNIPSIDLTRGTLSPGCNDICLA